MSVNRLLRYVVPTERARSAWLWVGALGAVALFVLAYQAGRNQSMRLDVQRAALTERETASTSTRAESVNRRTATVTVRGASEAVMRYVYELEDRLRATEDQLDACSHETRSSKPETIARPNFAAMETIYTLEDEIRDLQNTVDARETVPAIVADAPCPTWWQRLKRDLGAAATGAILALIMVAL